MVLTDSLPTGLTAVTVTDAGGGTCTVADVVTCRWTTISAQQTRQVTLAGTVDPAVPDRDLTNTASVTAPVDDADPTDNTASATVTIASTADVHLTKAAAPDPAVPGRPVTFTLVAANDGPQRAAAVLLTDEIPAGLTVTTVDDPDCTVDDGVLSCLFDGIDAGDSRTVTITADLPASYSNTSLTNTATATSLLTEDPDPENNTGTATVPIAPVSNVTVTKTATAGTVNQQETVGFTVTVTNHGPSDQGNVVVAETPDSGLVITSAVPGTGTWDAAGPTWTVPTLPVGASATLTVNAVAAEAGTLTNIAALVGSDHPDTDPTDNVASVDVTVDPIADLSIAKAVTPLSASAGGRVTYQLTATNSGPSTAQSVHVIDAVPAAVTDPVASTMAGSCAVTGQRVDCDLGDLTSAGSATVTVTGVVDPAVAGQVVNTAEISAITADPDPTNNTATAGFTATASATTTAASTGSSAPATPATTTGTGHPTLADTGAPIDRQATAAIVLWWPAPC